MGVNSYNDWDFEDEKLKLFFKYLKNNYNSCHNIGTFVKRMKENEDAEILIKMGFKITSWSDIDQNSLNCINLIPKDIRKWFISQEFFNPKVVYFLKDKLHQDIMRNLMLLEDNQFIKEFLIYWFSHCLVLHATESKIADLIKTYNLEIKRLIPYMYYLAKSEVLYGYKARERFSDYLKMAKVVYPNGRFEKYPKYLKSKHDILSVHYNLFKESFPEELFQQAYENYDYEYSNAIDKYIILQPTSTMAIKEEGRDLSHCVKSYISSIIDKQTLIYFMRDIEEQDKSLLTIEIFDNQIKQVHGEFNRNPTQKEMNFLIKFAKNKNLEINKYITIDN